MKRLSIFLCLLLLSFSVMVCSTTRSNKITLTVDNKSDILIERANFEINQSRFVVEQIKPHEAKQMVISKDSVKTNSHDVLIIVSLNSKEKTIKGRVYYNDLSGALNDNYTVTLKEDMKVLIN